MPTISGRGAKVYLWNTENSYTVIAGGDNTLILELKPEIVQAFEGMAIAVKQTTTTIKTLEKALQRIEWTDIQ